MPLVTACSFLAVAVNAKSSANQRSWRHPHMGVAAIGVGTVSFSKVQARWGPLWGEVV